jgi:O-antigen/teichoic acid export membrane protein
MFRPVAAYALNIILYQVFGNALFLFERAYVIRHFGQEEAAVYLIPMLVAIYLLAFTSSAVQATFPVMNELLDRRDTLSAIYQNSTRLVLAIVGFALVSVVLSGRLVLTVWIDEQMADDGYWILVLHCLSFGLIAVGINAWSLAEGFRATGLNVLLTAFWATVGISLMFFLGPHLGSEGVAAARLIGVALTLPVIFYCERRFLGRVQSRFWKSALAKVFLAILAAGLVEYLIVFHLGASNFLRLGAAGLAGAAAFGGALLVTGFVTGDEREQMLRLVLRR